MTAFEFLKTLNSGEYMETQKLTETVLAEALHGLPVSEIHCPESV